MRCSFFLVFGKTCRIWCAQIEPVPDRNSQLELANQAQTIADCLDDRAWMTWVQKAEMLNDKPSSLKAS